MPHPASSKLSRSLYWGLALWLSLRVAAFLLSRNYSYDAVTRTWLAQEWLRQPKFVYYASGSLTPRYGPLPIYLMGLALKFLPDADLAPRLVSLIFGCLALIPLYQLTRRLFGSQAAGLSLLFGAGYSLHIRAAGIASSEAVFCFFLLWACSSALKYRQEGCWSAFFLSALAANLAAMCRYNGWLYIPLLVLLILPRGMLLAAIFLLLESLFPLVWMFENWRRFGQALYPIQAILAEHRALSPGGVGVRLYNAIFWPAVLGLSLSPGVAWLFCCGVWRLKRWQREAWWLLAAAAFPLSIYFFRSVILGDFFPLARFVTDTGLLLIPFAAYYAAHYAPGLARILAVSVVFWLFCLIFLSRTPALGVVATKLDAVSPISRLEPGQEKIVAYLRRHPPRRGKVLIDHNTRWNELEIIFYSGLPKEAFIQEIRQGKALLAKGEIAYLILLPDGLLSRSLYFAPSGSPLVDQGGFCLYEVFAG